MKPLLLFLALLVSVVGVSQNVKADERNYYYHPEYNWNADDLIIRRGRIGNAFDTAIRATVFRNGEVDRTGS